MARTLSPGDTLFSDAKYVLHRWHLLYRIELPSETAINIQGTVHVLELRARRTQWKNLFMLPLPLALDWQQPNRRRPSYSAEIPYASKYQGEQAVFLGMMFISCHEFNSYFNAYGTRSRSLRCCVWCVSSQNWQTAFHVVGMERKAVILST